MNTTNAENSLDADMAEVKKSLDAIRDSGPINGQKVAARSVSELEKLNAPIEALYAQKRRDLVELQIRYHRDSVEMATAYHGKLSDLEHEAREAIRALDKKFQADAAPLRAMLDRLEAMRE